MSHRILGPQMAAYARDNGGASVYFKSGQHVEGPGFMVAEKDSEQRVTGSSPTGDEISAFADHRYGSSTPPDNAAMGVWGNVMDESRKHGTVPETRRLGKANEQEAAYVLPKTPVGGQGTPESLNRPYGTDMLLNLGHSQSASGSTFLDLHSNEAETINQSLPRHSTRQVMHGRAMTEIPDRTGGTDHVPDPRHVSLKEIDNDSWSETNRANQRRSVPTSTFTPGHDERRRENIGDVYRTINRGRTYAARGLEMTANPTKGWHRTDSGPSKTKRNADDGERRTVEYNEALEAERPKPRNA